jgi:hypothetical protein
MFMNTIVVFHQMDVYTYMCVISIGAVFVGCAIDVGQCHTILIILICVIYPMYIGIYYPLTLSKTSFQITCILIY